MNQILVEGGFAPEWIMLKRDIIDQRDDLKQILRTKCNEIIRNDKGRKHKIKTDMSKNQILDTATIDREWKKYCELIEKDDELLRTLNKNIDRFNLIVPMMKSQMFHFNLKREAEKIYSSCLKQYEIENEEKSNTQLNETSHNDNVQQEKNYENTFKSSFMSLGAILKSFVVLIRENGKR